MGSHVLKLASFKHVFTRRKKRSSSAAIEDPDFVCPGLPRDEVRKHRSCKVHMLSKLFGQQATRKQAEQIEDKYGTAFCFYDSIPHGSRSRKGDRDALVQSASVSSDPVSLQATGTSPCPDQLQATGTSSARGPFQAKNMSTGSFSEHIESLWRSFPAEKLVNFTYLECLWFGLYRKKDQRTKVLSWIKKKKIFSRNYVFVPICLWRHWYLLILCNFGEGLDSELKKPFMLLLDSLHTADPRRLEKEIKDFVLDIYKGEGISDQRVSKIPLQVPKVPQQRNKECGFFTLYFIKKFMEEAPEAIFDRDVPFINQNWFGREEFDGFCVALEKESKERSQLKAKTSKEMVHESDSEGDVVIINY